jgi:phage/plasmid-associated DNA primase
MNHPQPVDPEPTPFTVSKEVPNIPRAKKLVDEHGFPYYLNKADDVSKINEIFWAAYLASEQEHLLFEFREKEFYSYEPKTGLFVTRSVDSLRKDLAALILNASRTWEGEHMKELGKFRSEAVLRGVLAHLRGQREEKDPFETDRRIIHCANCVLQFNSNGSYARKAFSADFRSRNASPVLYVPGAKCAQFKDKLLAPLDSDSQELLQKYAGQILLGHNFSHRMLMLDGESDAGKTTVILVIAGIVGERNIAELRTHLLHERFELTGAIGKTLLLGPDVKADFLSTSGASKLKAMVGGDLLDVESKNVSKRHQVRGHWNALLSSNSRLKIRLEGDQKAWRRRLAIIRYELGRFGIRITDFHLVLLATEASGILNWMLEGASKLQADLSAAGDIKIPKRHQDLVDSLLNESDSLRIFLQTNIEKAEPKSSIPTAEIIKSYLDHCVDNSWQGITPRSAENDLPDLMGSLFGVLKRNDVKSTNEKGKEVNVRGYYGVRFIP